MDISKYSTPEQIERRIAQCVKQRDHAADVMGNLVLAMTYQLEINELVDKRDALPRQLHADCPACGVGLNIEVPKAKPQAVQSVKTYTYRHSEDGAGLQDESGEWAPDGLRLVSAEDHAAAIAAERAACAALAEAVGAKKEGHSVGYRSAAWEVAALIRGRGANRA